MPDLQLVLDIATHLAQNGVHLVIGTYDRRAFEPGRPQPRGTEIVSVQGRPSNWVRETAQPSDLVIMMASPGSWAFGLESARLAKHDVASVAVVARPSQAAALSTASDLDTQLVVGCTAQPAVEVDALSSS